MADIQTCAACGVLARPVKNSPLWWLAAAPTYALLALGLALAAVSPPLNLVLVPCLFFVNASLVSFFAEKLAREARCPACGRVHAPARPSAPAVLPGGPPAPADERAVERRLVGEA